MIAVIGAGVAGLTAAYRLARSGHEVTVFEAGDRVGGQLHTLDLDGVRVDVGAESAHLGAPHLRGLTDELGLTDEAVGSRPGASLLVTGRGLKPLPAGVGPTGPTRLRPVLESGILGPFALARAGLEPVLARRRRSADQSVGAFVRGRFGNKVAQEFVDPLLGNLHGGDIDALSLHATAGQLRAAAAEGRSLVLKRSSPPSGAAGGPPMFASWPQGLRRFSDALVERGGFEVRLRTRVARVRPDGDRWVVGFSDGRDDVDADAVVFAAGAAATAVQLRDSLSPAVLALLTDIPHADVATVVLGVDRASVAGCAPLQEANGLLLASERVRTMKAATFLSRKWPHLAASEHYLLRASVGRAGDPIVAASTDQELIAGVRGDLRRLIGLDAVPALARVVRWPQAMPQLVVGHLDRLASMRADLDGLPPAALAGGPFDGLGLVSTTRSGLQAAEDVTR